MRALVTGSSGLVGSEVVRLLSDRGVEVVPYDLEGHVVLMVASSDISTSGRSTLEWVQAIHPDIEWRGDDSFVDQPYRTLIRIGEARRVLGWEPRFTWKAFVDSMSNVAAS